MIKIRIETFKDNKRILSQVASSNKTMFDYLIKNHHKTIDFQVLFRYGKPKLYNI